MVVCTCIHMYECVCILCVHTYVYVMYVCRNLYALKYFISEIDEKLALAGDGSGWYVCMCMHSSLPHSIIHSLM